MMFTESGRGRYAANPEAPSGVRPCHLAIAIVKSAGARPPIKSLRNRALSCTSGSVVTLMSGIRLA